MRKAQQDAPKYLLTVRSERGSKELRAVTITDGAGVPRDDLITARGLVTFNDLADLKDTANWCLNGDHEKYNFIWTISTKRASEGTARIYE